MNKIKGEIRVLGITSYRFLPAITGGQKGIALFYKYFSRLVECYCATVKDNSTEAKDGDYTLLPVFSTSKFRYVNPFYFFSLRRIIQEKNISHIILEHPYFGWLGFLLKKFTGVKLIIHSHNIEALRFRSLGKWWWKLLLFYEKTTHRVADLSFFITEEERVYAIEQFQLEKNTCVTITFGTEIEKATTREEKETAKKAVCQRHNIPENSPLLLFNASFRYPPNLKALDNILSEINPRLSGSALAYRILICGIDLPDSYGKLSEYSSENVIYAGFVEDIHLYFLAADVFLNPIIEGGGIKTKVVEALAAGCSVVSFKKGAYGIPVDITGGKLQITEDSNYDEFTACIRRSTQAEKQDIPASFFEHFNWGKIAERAKARLTESFLTSATGT